MNAVGIDKHTIGVVRLDLATGNRTTISGFNMGSGPMLTNTSHIASSPDGQRRWLRQGQTAIVGVDVPTGNRTLVADEMTGSGPAFGFITDIVYDTPRLLVITTDAVLDRDPSTGNRIPLSNAQTGNGPTFNSASDGALNGQGTLHLLQSWDVYSVELATGNRKLVPKRGTGELTRTPYDGLSCDEAGILYTYGQFLNGMVAIDPVTGERVMYAK